MVPFENLTPENADISWIGPAIAGIAAAQTEGDKKFRTIAVNTVRDAQTLNAERVLSGYYLVQEGRITAHLDLRDEVGRRTLKSIDLTGNVSRIGDLASSVAKETGAPVHNWYNASNSALSSYFAARSAADPAAAFSLLERAVAADPSFGAAAVVRIEFLARSGNEAVALASIPEARKARLTASDSARLDLVVAQARKNAQEQAAALTKLAHLDTASPQLWKSVATAQMTTKDYKAAAEAAAHALELQPLDDSMLNLRGYALGFSGDLPASRTAFEEYRKTFPGSYNPIDSLGEMLFYYRLYDEAGKLFMEAAEKDQGAVNGSETFRAALCRYLLNDRDGADKLFNQYISARRKAGDAQAPLREAIWMRLTRRQPAPPTDSVGLATSSMWALLDGDREKARSLAEAARRSATTPSTLSLATTSLIVSQPSASPDIWEARLAQLIPDPRQAHVKSELLGWSLLLDRRYPEAVRAWRSAWNQSSSLTGENLRILLTWSLIEAGQIDEARRVMPQGWLPPMSLEPGLGVLIYPRIIDLRTKL
ncbi:MAG: hypothetical protein H7Y20_05890 [Bryobacteraceae bacterium]|nr:hypothetical protein [Bryobacteraceae bacterium]